MGNRLRGQITTAGLQGTLPTDLHIHYIKEKAGILTPRVIKGTTSVGEVTDHNSSFWLMGLLITNNDTVDWQGKICGLKNSLLRIFNKTE